MSKETLDYLCSQSYSRAEHIQKFIVAQAFLKQHYFVSVIDTEECKTHHGDIITVSLFKDKTIKTSYSKSIHQDYDDTIFDILFSWLVRVGYEDEPLPSFRSGKYTKS